MIVSARMYTASMHATRLLDEPIIHPGMDDRIGANINGPSVICVPDWVEAPLGRYYLYFAHHRALSSVWLMRMILRGHGISIVRGCWMCPSHSLPQPIHRNLRLISGPVGQIHCPEAISTPTLPRRMCISMSPGKGFACTTMAFWMMVIKKLG